MVSCGKRQSAVSSPDARMTSPCGRSTGCSPKLVTLAGRCIGTTVGDNAAALPISAVPHVRWTIFVQPLQFGVLRHQVMPQRQRLAVQVQHGIRVGILHVNGEILIPLRLWKVRIICSAPAGEKPKEPSWPNSSSGSSSFGASAAIHGNGTRQPSRPFSVCSRTLLNAVGSSSSFHGISATSGSPVPHPDKCRWSQARQVP